MRQFTRLVLAGGVILAAILGWVFWTPAVEVETAVVRQGHFEETIREDGQTRVRERYVVAAPLAGTLLRIALKAGDTVKAGDVVASIQPNRAPLLDPRARIEAEQRLGAAEATLQRTAAVVAQAEGVARQAETEADRSRVLVAQGAAPRSRLERDALALHTANRELDAARLAQHAAMHEAEVARAALFLESGESNVDAPAPVHSPVSGRALRVTRQSEGPVSLGAALVEIGDPSDLEVVADVLTTDAVRVHPGDPVRIEAWGGDRPLDGEVRLVEPGAFTKVSALGVDEQRTNVVVDITSPPAARTTLGDAYRVDVRIIIAAQNDATVVPLGALFRDQDGWFAFVVSDGRAHKRGVALSGRSESEAAVTKGLAKGEQVILFPGDAIADGVPVRAR